jgi:hypothetical protein
MAIALDTLAYARRLREAGFSAQQAEGQAEALAAAMTDTLATKPDLHELETRMNAGFAAAKHDMRELEIRMDAGFTAVREGTREMELRMDARFDAKLADLERRMTTRLGTVTVAAVTVVSVLVKLL